MPTSPSATSSRPKTDVLRSTKLHVLVALRLIDWTGISIEGSRRLFPDHDASLSLVGCAARGGPLDPAVAGSGAKWMEVLSQMIWMHLDLAATGSRVWRQALEVRPGGPADSVRSAVAVGVLELLRGNLMSAERWFEEAVGEVEAVDGGTDHAWIAETIEALGVGRER